MRTLAVLARCASPVVLAVVWIAACGDDTPTSPSLPPQGLPTFPTRLELVGPESVAPGSTVQFKALEHNSDGSAKDITNVAVWRTGDPAVLSVSSTGLVRGHQAGETWLSIAYLNRSSTRQQQLVLPDGTYRLSGTVRDAGIPISGAQVAVTSGSGYGLSVLTSDGRYRLYGVAGLTEIRVTKTGYHQEIRQFEVARHETADFDLRLSSPRLEIAGTYRLNIQAAPDCQTLTDDLRTREYTASLAQTGPTVTVSLEGASFATDRGRLLNRFQGVVELDHVNFRVAEGLTYYGFYIYNYPDVLEEFMGAAGYSFSGTVRAAVSSSRISGPLNGVVGSLSTTLQPIRTCRSTSHQFVLSR